jgi:hypothetical protein
LKGERTKLDGISETQLDLSTSMNFKLLDG